MEPISISLFVAISSLALVAASIIYDYRANERLGARINLQADNAINDNMQIENDLRPEDITGDNPDFYH